MVDTPEVVRLMQLLLSSQTELVLVPLQERTPVTGDPEDDYVLATARLARVDYLVTGDKGLLALADHAGTKMATPRAFVALLHLVS